mgnify:CR=1 FL=1
MADTNQNTRGQLPDNDPFAELTRIMGLDPRPAASATVSVTIHRSREAVSGQSGV